MALQTTKQLLIDYGVSAIELATELSTNIITLYNWLNGKNTTMCMLLTHRFAEAYEVDINELREKYNLK